MQGTLCSLKNITSLICKSPLREAAEFRSSMMRSMEHLSHDLFCRNERGYLIIKKSSLIILGEEMKVQFFISKSLLPTCKHLILIIKQLFGKD